MSWISELTTWFPPVLSLQWVRNRPCLHPCLLVHIHTWVFCFQRAMSFDVIEWPFWWIFSNCRSALPPGSSQALCWLSHSSSWLYPSLWSSATSSVIRNVICADTRASGCLQKSRHFCKRGKHTLVNTKTDFHELYPTLRKKINSPWLQKSNELGLQRPRT